MSFGGVAGYTNTPHVLYEKNLYDYFGSVYGDLFGTGAELVGSGVMDSPVDFASKPLEYTKAEKAAASEWIKSAGNFLEASYRFLTISVPAFQADYAIITCQSSKLQNCDAKHSIDTGNGSF